MDEEEGEEGRTNEGCINTREVLVTHQSLEIKK